MKGINYEYTGLDETYTISLESWKSSIDRVMRLNLEKGKKNESKKFVNFFNCNK